MKTYIVIFCGLCIAVSNLAAGPPYDFCGTIKALEEYHRGTVRQRPTLSGPVQYIEYPNFRVHYTTQGSDAVSPQYAETVAVAMAYSWAKLVDTLGWAPPPPDFNLGGDNRYDIYIQQLSSGVAGVTYSENSYPNPYPNGVSSHFRITRGLDYNYLKSTVCHEFFHAIQFRYSSVEGSWWMENTATWSEDIVYDDYNDHLGFLSTSPGPFTTPEYPITTFNNLYQYAGCVWPIYLTERYGSNCVRRIWEYQGQISGQNTLSGIDYVLTNYFNSNLITALKEYAVWRYFTGSRADTVHYYSEGHLYPQVRILRTHYNYPVSGDHGSYPVSNPGGTSYVQFFNGGGDFMIFFNAQSVYRWRCHVVGYQSGGNSTINELTLNTSGAGGDTLSWGANEHFALIPTAVQWEYQTGSLPFSYNANIRITHDVGIVNFSGIPSFADSGTVIFPQALVKNFGLTSETFPLSLNVGTFYRDSLTVSLGSGESLLINFRPCTLTARDYQNYRCKTHLTTDERLSNDSVIGRVFVRVRDVGVITILMPSGQVNQGTFVIPQARVKNYGNAREIFDVDFTIGSWQTTKRISLSGGLEFDVAFDSLWYANPPGVFIVKCSTKLIGDMKPDNDCAFAQCTVLTTAYSEDNYITHNPNFLLKITNSAKSILIRNFSCRNQLELTIYEPTGQKIYHIRIQEQKFTINKSLRPGIYFVHLKSDNYYETMKLIIY
ncbi:MAG: T9SS type A sorting domain-containing protein [candidate division WOR-3 bacterium]|nr:T9SS type A sorting domain-containing protein [candidate division WOR-3 bacterium]MDW7987556.1 T9SS type A sorting domain-containing protein [candidate division WOR-3 bacterium]